MIVIVVRLLPEGVWLATSPDLPGLIVEEETEEECVRTARQVAAELLVLQPPYDIQGGGTSAPPGKFQVW